MVDGLLLAIDRFKMAYAYGLRQGEIVIRKSRDEYCTPLHLF